MGEEEEEHTLSLPTFYIARYPVTVAQFRAFVETAGYKLKKKPQSPQGRA